MPSTSSKPSHTVFAVSEGRDGGKSNWMPIGACWPHQDGHGFNVKLEALPLNGASIVIRVREDKPNDKAKTAA